MKTAARREWVLGVLLACLCLVLAGCSLFQDQPPVARLTATPLSGTSPLEVAFDASTSSDPDGTVISYAWDFDDGTTGTGRNPSHTFTTATTRTYTVIVTVTDDDGTTGTASQTIEVQAGSTPSGGKPTARFNASPPYGDSPLTVQFDASLSFDPDGVVQVYGWDFGDAKTGSGKVISHTYSPTATTQYTVTLTVRDDDGETASTSSLISVFVTVEVPTDGPTASFTASAPIRIYTSPGRPSIPSLFEVTFDPRASVPSPGHQLKVYYWDFGDGQTTTATTDDLLTHRYASGASSHTYVATLTVVDDQGLSSSTVRNVTVTNPDEL